MIIIYNEKTDAPYNIAFEEFILKKYNSDEDILLFWQNKNAIIVGRNQNALEQINKQKADELDIQIVRRLSGGGAVYQDLGNICFTFITNFKKSDVNNYQKFTQPIINALRKEFGLNAEFSGKNDIQIDGKKISGNAQLKWKDKLMSHGTILFNVNTSVLADVLYVDKSKLISKGIKSIRSRVTNIKPLLKKDIDSKKFIEILIKYFEKSGNKVEKIDKNIDLSIKKIVEDKYSQWDWNFGKSPEANLDNKLRFQDAGLLNIRAYISEGKINYIRFLGDYMSSSDVSKIEKLLIDKKYDPKIIRNILKNIDLKQYFGKITLENIIQVMFSE